MVNVIVAFICFVSSEGLKFVLATDGSEMINYLLSCQPLRADSLSYSLHKCGYIFTSSCACLQASIELSLVKCLWYRIHFKMPPQCHVDWAWKTWSVSGLLIAIFNMQVTYCKLRLMWSATKAFRWTVILQLTSTVLINNTSHNTMEYFKYLLLVLMQGFQCGVWYQCWFDGFYFEFRQVKRKKKT